MSYSNSLCLVSVWICCGLFAPIALQAQNSPHPTAAPQPGRPPQLSPEQYQQAVEALKSSIGVATGKVFGNIQNQESTVFTRFSYFQKPERYDPGAFASKSDVTAWQQSLKEMRTDQTTLENMYTSADLDLGNALTGQRIPPQLSNPIKKELLSTFPWDVIHQKNQLMDQYIDEHNKLLDFYATNWGTWSKPQGATKAEFNDKKLASSFAALCTKIQSDGKQLETLYGKMKQ